MQCFAVSSGIELQAPPSAPVSFFTSPYPGHRAATAADVYYRDGKARFPAPQGTVRDIQWHRSPDNRPDKFGREPVIVIELDGSKVLKVLHVDPAVKIGDLLTAGDVLGETVVSGYFSRFTDLHAHYEVRPSKDPLRARGAYAMDITHPVREAKPDRVVTQYTITSTSERYAWIEPCTDISPHGRPAEDGPFPGTGLAADIDGVPCYIEGGIPHFKYLAAYVGDMKFATGEPKITLPNGRGVKWPITLFDQGVGLFELAPIVSLGEVVMKGVETFAGCPYVKAVVDYDTRADKEFSEGDVIELRFDIDPFG